MLAKSRVVGSIIEVVVEEYGISLDPDLVRHDTTLTGLGLDSIEAFELVSKLEERFGITIDAPDGEFQRLATVGGLAEYIERQMGLV